MAPLFSPDPWFDIRIGLLDTVAQVRGFANAQAIARIYANSLMAQERRATEAKR